MGSFEDTLNFLEKHDSTNILIKDKLELFKKQYKDESGLEYSKKNVLYTFTKWLEDKGAKFNKIKMKYYAPDFRGVYAFRKIKKNEVILSVPNTLIITPQRGRETDIGIKVKNSGVKIFWEHLFYITLFLMEQFHDDNSIWKPYINVYPKIVGSFPLFYTEEEKLMLEGSAMLSQIESEIEEIKNEYERIATVVPEIRKFTVEEYMRNKTLVISRIFFVNIHGTPERIMVPFADMFNHHYDKIGQTSWKYDNSSDSFVVTAKRDIPASEAVLCMIK